MASCDELSKQYDELLAAAKQGSSASGYQAADGVKDQIRAQCPDLYATKFEGKTFASPPSITPINLSETSGNIQEGNFYILNAHNGKAMATDGASNGAGVKLYTLSGDNNQVWNLSRIASSEKTLWSGSQGKTVRIQHVSSGRYLDADKGNRVTDGSPIIVWDRSTESSTLFYPYPNQHQMFIINKLADKKYQVFSAIDLGLGAVARNLDGEMNEMSIEGGEVQNWSPINQSNQQWQFIQVPDFNNLSPGRTVSIRASNGKYVCADTAAGGVAVADRSAVGGWETWRMLEVGVNAYAFLSKNLFYLCADQSKNNQVMADRRAYGEWERFSVTDLGGGKYSLKGSNGKYVRVDGGGLLYADRDSASEAESFTLSTI